MASTTALASIPPLYLFRSLMRQAKSINDYNFRSYATRRVRRGFDMNRSLQGAEAVNAIRKGVEQLAVLKRQSTLGNMYPSGRSVMENSDIVIKELTKELKLK